MSNVGPAVPGDCLFNRRAKRTRALTDQEITDVAITGFSHGGGSTHDLAEALNPLGYGIAFTAYIDAVENDSDGDIQQEQNRPLGSAFHMNFFQHGTLADLGLDGGPIQNPQVGDFELDVETTNWGADITHGEIDNFMIVVNQVNQLNPVHTQINQQLRQRVSR